MSSKIVKIKQQELQGQRVFAALSIMNAANKLTGTIDKTLEILDKQKKQ